MREEITVTAKLVFDCDATRSREQQSDDCKEDIFRLLDADSQSKAVFLGCNITRFQSESETYKTDETSAQRFQIDRMNELLKAAFDNTEDPAELLAYALCDLRHFADAHSLNFATADRKGYSIYAEERA